VNRQSKVRHRDAEFGRSLRRERKLIEVDGVVMMVLTKLAGLFGIFKGYRAQGKIDESSRPKAALFAAVQSEDEVALPHRTHEVHGKDVAAIRLLNTYQRDRTGAEEEDLIATIVEQRDGHATGC
jgi:hypothetical protein